MTDMREYAAQHGWEVGSHLRYAGGVGPSSVITSIEAHEVRISTPGDFPGRLTGGSSSGLGKWTLDWQYRAEQAEAAIARVRDVCRDPSKRMLATSHMNVEWVDLNAVLNALEGDKR